jgi:hypothetical protein
LLASLVLLIAAATKKRKEEAYLSKAGASSRHITNLKQSILETFDIYGWFIEQKLDLGCNLGCDLIHNIF